MLNWIMRSISISTVYTLAKMFVHTLISPKQGHWKMFHSSGAGLVNRLLGGHSLPKLGDLGACLLLKMPAYTLHTCIL